jgi:hypothetical protein
VINATDACFQSSCNLRFIKAEGRPAKGDEEAET